MTDSAREALQALTQQMSRSVIGQESVLRSLLISLLCNGHVLLEGLPGTAKTRSIRTLAQGLGVSLGRIQFTPDLLPADITGSEVYREHEGHGVLTFERGPIFHELVLADEINRAPAKVQSALLEAMEERQVTVAGKTYTLPALFLVLATQNPIEQEGTYPLPEAQTDRFVFKINIDLPDASTEREILRLAQREESQPAPIEAAVTPAQIFSARDAIQHIDLSEPVENYVVDLIMATRHPQGYGGELARWLVAGCSPRASIALHRASRAEAWLQGRDHVLPDDVRAVIYPALRHRLLLSYDALADGISPDQVIDELLARVAIG